MISCRKMPLALYAVSDGPPSLAVRQALKYLELEYDLINVNFGIGEHMTSEFAEVSFYANLGVFFCRLLISITEKSPERVTSP